MTDYVLGLTTSATALSDFTVRRRSRRTLDLGCGSGLQAFLAAQHSDAVTGTDCNLRAVRLSRFGALLNGFKHADFVAGDLFEPVAGRKFDLIVSNPPLRIGPGYRYSYRDSDLPADGFCRRLAREAPAYLEAGGLCQFVCDWVHLEGQDWRQRLASWFEGSGCDALVIVDETRDVEKYAQDWIHDTEPAEPDLTAKLYVTWMEYYQREKIEAISSGVITMRRRDGTNWFHTDTSNGTPGAPVGEWLELSLQQVDFLKQTGDESLLATRLRLSPNARVEQACQCESGRWSMVDAELGLEIGLPLRGKVDGNMIRLLGACNGERTLREALATLLPAAALDKLPPSLVSMLRLLVGRGILLPAKDL
jgi:SAM-dependent methyltransferase